jgi:hypothetical protein
LTFESLEDRRLPSVTLPPPGSTGPAIMTGTSSSETFIVRNVPLVYQGPGGVTTGPDLELSDNGGLSWSVTHLADVTSIAVHAVGGNNTLIIDDFSGLVGKPGGLPISFDVGGAGAATSVGSNNTLVLTGFAIPGPGPLNSSTVHNSDLETYTYRGPNALMITNVAGGRSQTITFNAPGQVQDTLPAARVYVNVAGFYSDHMKISGGGSLNGTPVDEISGFVSGAATGGRLAPTFALALTPIYFAGKTSVSVHTLGINNSYILNVTQAAEGLNHLTLIGGAGNNSCYVYSVPNNVIVSYVHIQHIYYRSPGPRHAAARVRGNAGEPFGLF